MSKKKIKKIDVLIQRLRPDHYYLVKHSDNEFKTTLKTGKSHLLLVEVVKRPHEPSWSVAAPGELLLVSPTLLRVNDEYFFVHERDVVSNYLTKGLS